MSDYTGALASLSDQDRELIKSEAAQRKKEDEALFEKARQAAKDAQRAAQIDYTTYTNPYGRQAETVAAAGLGASSLSETNRAKAYNAYQNRLSAADKTRAGEVAALNNNITSLAIQTDRSLLESKVAQAKQQLEEYWKNLEWDYQKERDAVSDARYDREWAYKLSNASASSARSGSLSSSAASASKTAASSSASAGAPDPKAALLSKLGSFVRQGAARRENDIKGYIAEAEAYGALAQLPNYYPQLEMLLSIAGASGATEEELKTIVQKWHKS